MHYLRKKFIILCLFFLFKLIISQETDSCNCSRNLHTAQIKCLVESTNINSPSCTVTFGQADDVISQAHTRCIEKNVFATEGDHPGQLRKIVVFCTAPYPLRLSFDGMMPHQSIGIANYRYANPEFENQTLSKFIVSMDVEPEITGRYSIFPQNGFSDRMGGTVDFYIFAENGRFGPYLLNEGKILRPIFTSNALILPCRPFKRTTNILVTKNNAAFTDYDQFDTKLGFVINLTANRPISSLIGEYQCLVNDLMDGMGSKVTIIVSSADFNSTMEMIPPLEEVPSLENLDLNLNVTGKWAVCLSEDKSRKYYRLVNMRSRNPLESSMKTLCFAGDAECLGKREGSFSRCHASPRICKAVDFKEGGGIISCFHRNSKTVKEPHNYILGLDGKTYLNPDTRSVPIQALMGLKAVGNKTSTFYTDIEYSFTCTAVSYLFAQPLMIDVLLSNGTRIPISPRNPLDATNTKEIYDISSTNIVFNNYKVEAKLTFESATVTKVVCSAFIWDLEETLDHILLVDVQKSLSPRFSENFRSAEFIRGQTNELECDTEALPEPAFEWEKDGVKIEGETSPKLIISNTSDKNVGMYSCRAINELGRAEKLFHVNVVDAASNGPGLLVTVGVPIGIVLIATIVCGLLIKYYRKTRTGLTQAEIEEFFKGIKTTDVQKTKEGENEYVSVISGMPYTKEYEVSDGKFNIDETSLLGSGAYGLVYKGSLDGRNIAVKTLKRNADVNYLRSLLTELKVMIYLNEHPNIVNLVGANTKHLDKGIVYVLVELCPLGNLETHLKNNRQNFVNEMCDYLNNPLGASVGSSSSIRPLNTSNLLKWSVQIASAMQYLEMKHVIHGDLATRNVLLQDNDTAKLSDFGLSRKLYEYSDYVKQSKEPLPWRHMSLESLKDLHFSSKSDVWAFGVTMWEIFSLGEVPYPGLTWNVEFVRDIENGLRMTKAKFSSIDLFELQLRCWRNEPEERPSFAELKKILEEQLIQIKSKEGGEGCKFY
ncbi:vascular endothelial growth factor receptor kdr-like isoform X2 [Folsomia candida]|uniref:vascular endothelial growth factor receptor kdr-like isoform X2 n=1 Tax=Folsomia candida TaxID=158441 RepID=UPI001604AA93|nr:vascular endothelial growth factor receptor kdr-like isoform X2 [Folsomia candida]